jgi:hypothetical protein
VNDGEDDGLHISNRTWPLRRSRPRQRKSFAGRPEVSSAGSPPQGADDPLETGALVATRPRRASTCGCVLRVSLAASRSWQ